MSTPARPAIECRQQHPMLWVGNVVEATQFYMNTLGFTMGFLWGEPPTMAGLNLGDVQVHLAKGTPGPDGCGVFFVVGNADDLLAFHRANGADVAEPIGDREYGLRDYRVRDPWGNFLGFGHYIYTAGEPVEIERVDVPLRLETRLAALMRDLAEYKRMSLSGCFEEILLHTCERLGDGVASPHTLADLRRIEELKRKHGIDYDVHASYRFVERPA